MSGEAEGEDTYFYIAGFYQFFGAGNDGGTCGYNIVYYQEMFTCYSLAMSQLKGIFHVFLTIPSASACLAALEYRSFYYIFIDRQACNLAYLQAPQRILLLHRRTNPAHS